MGLSLHFVIYCSVLFFCLLGASLDKALLEYFAIKRILWKGLSSIYINVLFFHRKEFFFAKRLVWDTIITTIFQTNRSYFFKKLPI